MLRVQKRRHLIGEPLPRKALNVASTEGLFFHVCEKLDHLLGCQQGLSEDD